jgi:hypothetical protein
VSRPWPLTLGEAFNRRMDSLAIPKAARALLSEHFAPQFRLNQRLYSDDSIVSWTELPLSRAFRAGGEFLKVPAPSTKLPFLWGSSSPTMCRFIRGSLSTKLRKGVESTGKTRGVIAKRRQKYWRAGRLSSENKQLSADPFLSVGRQHRCAALLESDRWARRSRRLQARQETLCTRTGRLTLTQSCRSVT